MIFFFGLLLEIMAFRFLLVCLILEFDLILRIWFSSATNRLITAKDHASVQINIGHLDESGVYNGHFTTFALCGFTRAQVPLTIDLLIFYSILDLDFLYFLICDDFC